MRVLRVLDALDASFSPVLGFLPSECVCKQSQNATKSPEPECNEKSTEKGVKRKESQDMHVVYILQKRARANDKDVMVQLANAYRHWR
jgi:hypothetical protein